jgi:hypothetical protein
MQRDKSVFCEVIWRESLILQRLKLSAKFWVENKYKKGGRGVPLSVDSAQGTVINKDAVPLTTSIVRRW